MPKSNRSDIILGCVGAAILVAGLMGTFYFYMKFKQVATRIEAKNREIKVIEEKIKRYPELLTRLDRLESEKKLLFSSIPGQEQQQDFTWDLGTMADQSGVKIDQCEILNDLKKYAKYPQYQIYQWKLTLHGDYESMFKFIRALSFAHRAAIISELKLAAQQNNSSARNILAASLIVDLPSSPDQEKVVK